MRMIVTVVMKMRLNDGNDGKQMAYYEDAPKIRLNCAIVLINWSKMLKSIKGDAVRTNTTGFIGGGLIKCTHRKGDLVVRQLGQQRRDRMTNGKVNNLMLLHKRQGCWGVTQKRCSFHSVLGWLLSGACVQFLIPHLRNWKQTRGEYKKSEK